MRERFHKTLVIDGKKMSFVGRPDPPPARARGGSSVTPVVGDPEQEKALPGETDGEESPALLETAPEVTSALPQTEGENAHAALGGADGESGVSAPVRRGDTKLVTEEFETALNAKLRVIQREAQLAKEELGVNTLFLTLGALEWNETEARSYQAPLLYVPVSLERQANGAIRLTYDGSDVGDNLPLRAKMAEFNLALPEFNEELSLEEYLHEIAATVALRSGWTVHWDAICLGFFNYEKYAMYRDLGGDAWPEEKQPWQNSDVAAMLGAGYVSPDTSITEKTFLDDVRPLVECREVYDADSSQTLAMIRAADGLSIVVEGPPGTGKSQTITNIIAEAGASGKTVLFVAAKRAAVDVVKRRLTDAGLGACAWICTIS